MDYYKDLDSKDFNSDDDYLAERVQRGMAAGYTFMECYDHWLEDLRKALHEASDAIRANRKHKVQEEEQTLEESLAELSKKIKKDLDTEWL